MKIITSLLAVCAAGSFLYGCGSDAGKDTGRSASPASLTSVGYCTDKCHSASGNAVLNPLTSNGAGASGKHIKHVQDHAIPCEGCHYNYFFTERHMNGTYDSGRTTGADVVFLNIAGPVGTWNSAAGQCANVACHGASTLDWYGPDSWAVPSGCTPCHSAPFAPSLDPTITNASGTSGKHARHVQERGISCERCHEQYFYTPSHRNGAYSPGRTPGMNMVSLNIAGPRGTWDASTGECADIACHGAVVLDWYGTNTWTTPTDCISCHASSFSQTLDPLVTNGSGTGGKHQRHVSDMHYECVKCHSNYPSHASHANGILASGDGSVPAVFFDSSNPSGLWTKSSGPGSGACSLMYCHGFYSGVFAYVFPDDGFTAIDKTAAYGNSGGTPSWYASGGGLGCAGCHGNPPTIPDSPMKYGWHSGFHNGGNECQLCHPDASGAGGIGTAITNTTLHINGFVDVVPRFENSCFRGCH